MKEHNKQKYEGVFRDLVHQLNNIKDARSKVLVLHLFIEYWLDEIIGLWFKNPKKILKYNFSKKLDILNGLGLIKGDTHHNISKVNEIRNTYVHEIDLSRITNKSNKLINELISTKVPQHTRHRLQIICVELMTQIYDMLVQMHDQLIRK